MAKTKLALVTGANRGIGKEIARQLIGKGFVVYVTSRDLSKAQDVAKQLGDSAIAMELNVADETSVKNAADKVSSESGNLDVLVNNAGIMFEDSMLDFNIKNINQVMQTNFMGPILTSKYFLPLLNKSSNGKIINISSEMGELASLELGGYASYRLSKTALNAFTILLGSELKRTSVKVFSVCPGWVKTDMGGSGASLPVEKGADTAVWLATEDKGVSGRFFSGRKEIDW